MQKLVNATDIAPLLGVSEARLYELARLGLIPCVRLGRQVRFDPAVVEAWVEGGGQALPGGWRREADDPP